MIRCKNCGTDNLDGSDYCDECGMRLELARTSSGRLRKSQEPPAYQPPTASSPGSLSSQSRKESEKQSDTPSLVTIDGVPPAPPSFTASTSIPKPAKPARDVKQGQPVSLESVGPSKTLVLSSRGRTDALRSEQTSTVTGKTPRVLAKLVIERGGRIGKEYPITGVESHIGRWDADNGIFPDVDLDQDDPEAKVSRRHARIVNQKGQFYVEDLGSTNGTFVNRGKRLVPGQRQILQNGDELIVGKTFLKFHIIK